MKKDDFKVAFRRADFMLMVFGGMLVAIVLKVSLTDFRGNLFFGVVMDIYLLGLSLLFFGAAYDFLVFCVQVNGFIIKVRNHSGRKYEFSVSDIEGVVCEHGSSVEHRVHDHVTIMAKSKQFWLVENMTGFYDMIEYILDKYGSGEIKEGAISEKDLKKLRWYRERGRAKKEKKRKRKP